MNELPTKSGRNLLLVWALVATLVAMGATALSLFLLLRPEGPLSPGAAPVFAVEEGRVVGRYRWSAAGEEDGIITLLPDHTFIPPKGRQTQYHRWEMGRHALLVIFAARIHRFTNIDSGVYVSAASDGTTARMEKEK